MAKAAYIYGIMSVETLPGTNTTRFMLCVVYSSDNPADVDGFTTQWQVPCDVSGFMSPSGLRQAFTDTILAHADEVTFGPLATTDVILPSMQKGA